MRRLSSLASWSGFLGTFWALDPEEEKDSECPSSSSWWHWSFLPFIATLPVGGCKKKILLAAWATTKVQAMAVLLLVVFVGMATSVTAAAGGGTCASPVDISSLSSPYSATTIGMPALSPALQQLCGNGDTDTASQVFVVTLLPSQTITLRQASNTYDSVHMLRYGGDCPGDNLVQCVDDPDETEVNWQNTLTTPQLVYYIQSGYIRSSQGDFVLEWNIATAGSIEAHPSYQACVASPSTCNIL